VLWAIIRKSKDPLKKDYCGFAIEHKDQVVMRGARRDRHLSEGKFKARVDGNL